MRQQFNMFAGIMAVIICFVFPISFLALVFYVMFQTIKHPIEKKQREKNINELLKQNRINSLKHEIEHNNDIQIREWCSNRIKLIESGEV